MINIKKVKLTANNILVTKEVYDGTPNANGVIIPKGTMKELQKVVAVGPMVRGIKEGDLVCLNLKRYEVHKYKEGSVMNDIQKMDKVVSYRITEIRLDNKPNMLLTEQDVDFIVEEFEETESSVIIDNTPKIIV